MGRYFFTGGITPSDYLLFYFNDHLLVEDHWRVNGRHYQQTCEDWLRLQDARSEQIMPIMQEVYGSEAKYGFNAGGCFSWPAPNCLAITAVMNGLSGIIYSGRFHADCN